MRRITGFVFLLAALNWLGGLSSATAAADSAPGAMINSARVPFVANKGQISNPEVKYYAKTFGGTVYALSDGKIVYSLPKYGSGKTAVSAVITEILQNAFHAQPVGSGKSAVAVNSFIGNRPENWRTNLPVFDRLDFGEIYDGISLLLSACGNNVEKIFVLSPGADPRDIAFGFEGASGIEITDDGELELQTMLGTVRFTRPVAWQVDDMGKSLPVTADYALNEEGKVCFELSAYDPGKVLVIDPLLASTFIGGGGADAVQAMTVDSQTNVYIAGYTDSSDFPTISPYQSTLAGGQDVFVSKFDANLGSLSASTYLGGSSNDQATAIGIDASSRIWLAGYTESANFPTNSAAMDPSYNGNGDAFVAVLSADLGTPFLGTYLGGSNADYAAAITMNNASRHQYVAGYTESTNFPVFSNGYQTNYNGARDAFTVLFSNDVSSLKGGTFLGGTNADEAAGVAVALNADSTNIVYVVGSSSSTNFPTTVGSYQRICGGSNDAFISRLSALLTSLPVSTFLGGTGSEAACAVAFDNVGQRVYVAGYTSSSNFPTTNTPYSSVLSGGQDVFVSFLTNNLTKLWSSTYIGGTNDDAATCIVVDSNTVYLAGYTDSSDFPTTVNAYNRSYNGGGDAFTLRFDGRLTNLYASTYLGGGASDQALAIALAPDSNTIFVAGFTESSDFPASDVAYETALSGTRDGFVSKFPASLLYGTLKWRKQINSICSSPAMTLDGTITIGNETSLFAVTRSGAERWQVVTTSAVAQQSDPLEGLGTPVVGTNNIIYINTSSGKVHAITSAGVPSVLFTGPGGNFWSAPALDNNGRLFFSQLAKFYSIDQNGIRLWTNTLVSDFKSSSVVGSNGTIYAVASDPPTTLYAFNPNGSTSNTWAADANMYASPALGTNDLIYAASSNKLYAFNSAGTTTMTWTADGRIYSSPAIGSNGDVYVGGGSNLYAFKANGTTRKVWNAAGEVKSSPAIAADGSIIVGATNGVYSFNPDGTTNWLYQTYALNFQSPLIDSDGTIYASDNYYMYAIYGARPPSESPWPMYRRDALRNGNQGMNVASFLRPTGLTASKYGTFTNYVRVGWNASANALNYEVWRNTSNSTAGASRIRRLTGTNYNDSSLDAGRIYYYWVKAKTPVTLSAFSDSDSGGIPPFPPLGVEASDGMPSDHVQVTWLSSTNATTYYVYRSLVNDSATASEIGSSSSTNYDDYNVVPGSPNYYWVKAANAEAGISGFSTPAADGGIPCSPPTGFSASQGASIHSVALSWNASTGASSYIVYRNTENNSDTAGIITNISGVSASDYAGTPLRQYYYWVKATNNYGLGGFSASALGWSLLAPPSQVSASAGTYSNMIRVSWVVGSTDVIAHVIFRSESSDLSTATLQSEVDYKFPTYTTNYDDTAIIRGPDYYYWVAARNNYGTSSLAAASAPGGTAPSTPTDLNASDGAYTDMVKIIWNSSPGATYYTVYRNETYDPSSATQINGSVATNYYDDTSAIHGTLYYYWVKAGNRYGISALSSFNAGWRAMAPPDSVVAGDGISTSEVRVTWSAAADATVYELWRGTSSNSSSANRLVNNYAATSYSDQSANPGTVYYYWVKSKRGTYSSAFSMGDSGYRAIGLLDIGISDFVFMPTVFGPLAHPAAVSFKVSNLSSIDMVEPNNTVQYDLYLSQNAVFGNGDYWIGSSEATLSLNAGASAHVVSPANARSSITIPAWDPGRYYVFIFVNHCLPSGWLDPNLANNSARRTGDQIRIASATAFQPVWNDYDGDGKTDLAVYQAGVWRFWLSTSGYTLFDLAGPGGAGYRIVPRDYDGDGKIDPAAYQETTTSAGSGQGGTWWVYFSAYGYQSILVTGMGGAGQSAVPADYDSDGIVDPAVYQEATTSASSWPAGTWRVWGSGAGYTEVNASGLGGAGWRPVPADYDGDGKADPAVYCDAPSTGSAGSPQADSLLCQGGSGGQAGDWRFWLSANSYSESRVIGWGGSDQRPVPADYDGDGRIDPAVYQEAGGIWRFWLSSNSYREISFAGGGGSGQTAVPGDYDGDGLVDAVVFWESMGLWRLWLSSVGYSEMTILEPGGIGFHAITAGE